MQLAPPPPERTDRHGVLEPHAAAGLQRKTEPTAVGHGEFRLNATAPAPAHAPATKRHPGT